MSFLPCSSSMPSHGLIPGVLGDPTGAEDDSSMGLLEYPHYTRPPEFHGWKVPRFYCRGSRKNREVAQGTGITKDAP